MSGLYKKNSISHNTNRNSELSPSKKYTHRKSPVRQKKQVKPPSYDYIKKSPRSNLVKRTIGAGSKKKSILTNLSQFTCSSAKFALIDAEYNMKMNLASAYLDLYKIYITNAIQRDQTMVDHIRNKLHNEDPKIKKAFERNLFTDAVDDPRLMAYYKNLFLLVWRKMIWEI